MSDRIAVMSEGRIEQIGSPKEIYEEPTTAYVADFLGVSNLMDAEARGPFPNGECRVRVGDFELSAGVGDTDAIGDSKVVIRPERIQVLEHGVDGANHLPAMVERTVYVGATIQLILRLPEGQRLQAMIPNRGEALAYRQGTPVSVFLPPDALRVLRVTAQPPSEEEEDEAEAPVWTS